MNKKLLKSNNYQQDRSFLLLQKITYLFIKDVYKVTDFFSSDDTISIVSKILFKQLSESFMDGLLECNDYRKGIEITLYEYEILTEIAKLFRDIKIPSLAEFNDDDFHALLNKFLI